MAKALGRPKQFDHRITFSADDELKQWLSTMSQQLGISEAEFVRLTLNACRKLEVASVARGNGLVEVVP
jgi:hypothetical protein